MRQTACERMKCICAFPRRAVERQAQWCPGILCCCYHKKNKPSNGREDFRDQTASIVILTANEPERFLIKLWSSTSLDTPDEFMSTPILPHPSTTTFEARGGLAALVILQWMWVTERALPSSFAKGTDSRVVTSVQCACTYTNTHQCARLCSDTHRRRQRPKHRDDTTTRRHTKNKTMEGWAADSQNWWVKATKPKTRISFLWSEDFQWHEVHNCL